MKEFSEILYDLVLVTPLCSSQFFVLACALVDEIQNQYFIKCITLSVIAVP